MLTEKGKELWLQQYNVEYISRDEPQRKIKRQKVKVSKELSRKQRIKDFQRVIYERNLKLAALSTGSAPDKQGVNNSLRARLLDDRLECQFGHMGTGKGYGIQALSTGVPIIEEAE